MLTIKVKDSGIGVASEDRANLFKPYFKSQNAISKVMNFQSHGLGLNICKRIARGIGGDLVLNEAEIHGSEFILTYPVEKIDLNRGGSQDGMSLSIEESHEPPSPVESALSGVSLSDRNINSNNNNSRISSGRLLQEEKKQYEK